MGMDPRNKLLCWFCNQWIVFQQSSIEDAFLKHIQWCEGVKAEQETRKVMEEP